MAHSASSVDSKMPSKACDSPQTPSERPSYSTRTTSDESPYVSIPWQNERPSRKRSRNDSWELTTPYSVAPSPAPFANMKYRLGGAQDSPIQYTSQNDHYSSMTPDTAFRRGRPYPLGARIDYFHEHCGDSLANMPGKVDNENGAERISLPIQSTWGSLVLDFAGKVFEFCTAGTFRGFFAGGGQGYTLKRSASTANDQAKIGKALDESSWPDIPSTSTMELEDEYPQTAKKSKTTHDNSWVVVQAPSRPSSPFAKTQSSSHIPRISSASLAKPTSPSKISLASTATIGHSQSPKRPTAHLHRTLSTRTASSAGLRSSETLPKTHQRAESIHSPSKLTRNITLEPQQSRKSLTTPSAIPVRTNHKASLSITTPTLHEGVQSYEQAESPLAKETRRHLDKVRRHAIAEDREIMKMNSQLEDLIKQGQEALGTRIEVEFGENEDW